MICSFWELAYRLFIMPLADKKIFHSFQWIPLTGWNSLYMYDNLQKQLQWLKYVKCSLHISVKKIRKNKADVDFYAMLFMFTIHTIIMPSRGISLLNSLLMIFWHWSHTRKCILCTKYNLSMPTNIIPLKNLIYHYPQM